jgi:hypothetical protein
VKIAHGLRVRAGNPNQVDANLAKRFGTYHSHDGLAPGAATHYSNMEFPVLVHGSILMAFIRLWTSSGQGDARTMEATESGGLTKGRSGFLAVKDLSHAIPLIFEFSQALPHRFPLAWRGGFYVFFQLLHFAQKFIQLFCDHSNGHGISPELPGSIPEMGLKRKIHHRA